RGAPARHGAAVAGVRVVRHVPRLRGPRAPLQVRSGAAPGEGSAGMRRGDRTILVAALALTGLGVVMVYSSSAILGITRYQNPNHFLFKQLFRVALGLGALVACVCLDLRRLERSAQWLLVVSGGLL